MGDDEEKKESASSDSYDFDDNVTSNDTAFIETVKEPNGKKSEKVRDGVHRAGDVEIRKKGFWEEFFGESGKKEHLASSDTVRSRNGRAVGKSGSGSHDFGDGSTHSVESKNDGGGGFLDGLVNGLKDDWQDDRPLIDKWFEW